jgi:hypothetical protein
MAKRSRKPSIRPDPACSACQPAPLTRPDALCWACRPVRWWAEVQFAAAQFEGAGKLQADIPDQTGYIVRGGVVRSDLHTAVGAKGHRAIQERKARQTNTERKAAFEHFGQMELGVLSNQMAAGHALDRIAHAIVAASAGQRSFKEARKRVGRLRKEFLRLRA